MSRSSPLPRYALGLASRAPLTVALTAAAFLSVSALGGPAFAQDDEFPGPDSPECTWAGERILSLLWRDDIRTATDFIDLYDRFDCPSEHIPAAFRCLVKVGVSPEQGDPGLPTRANACWANPAVDPASLQPAAAPSAEGGEAQAPSDAQPAPEAQPAGEQPAAQ
ncbi:hypothetical protein RUR49_20150 [Pseudoxanthobacter sp. M-2]|uniref:hypothetical protein n=1 Tax=Pseudoxanthobacter sp. M-2 TaxID=3078754 RepID=UPI0038FC4619